MHEHQALVRERVAVRIGEIAFGRGAHVCEDERGRGFGGDAREVDTVPCWDRGGEDTGLGAERGRGVVANAKAVAVVWASPVLEDVSRVRFLSCKTDVEKYQTKARVE